MVIRKNRPLAAAALTLLLFLAAAGMAAAQGAGEGEGPSLREEYRIELNEVGDARITDTIFYDPDWFQEYGYIFRENPNLLSRRFRADSRVGEVEDFDVDVDESRSTITVTFETPGLAYYLEDGWNLFGFGDYSLVKEGNDQVRLEAYWTTNSEFTLFETMDLEEEVVIDLPPGARGAEFDPSTGAVRYRLPLEEEAAGNLLYRKRGLFIPLFSVLMGLFLLLFLFAATRRTVEQAAPAAAPPPPAYGASPPPGASGAGAPVPPAPPPGTTEVPGAAGEAPKAPPPVAAPEPHGAGETAPRGFCSSCGHPIGPGDVRFCSKCGAPLG